MSTINKIIVKDKEVNEEFEIVSYSNTDDKVVIFNDNYRFCSQTKDNLEFVRVE